MKRYYLVRNKLRLLQGTLGSIDENSQMVLKKFLFLGMLFGICSCCFSVKEEYLGNNLYLSEYDNRDRRILYSEEKCSGSGFEIIPMTVTAYNFNDNWVIAESKSSENYNYWIIQNSYTSIPTADEIKRNTHGPLDSLSFYRIMEENSITLELNTIK